MGREKDNDAEKEKAKSYLRSNTTVDRSKTNTAAGKEKEPLAYKRTLSRYDVAKDLSLETKTRLSNTCSAIKKDEKGPPITFNTRYKVSSTRAKSRDPSPSVDSSSSQPQTALQRLTAARERSRDPSPSSYRGTSTARDRSRDPSPAYKNYSDAYRLSTAAKSRDPSPVARSYTDSGLSKTYSNGLGSKDKDSSLLSTKSNNSLSSREKSLDLSRRPSITSTYPRSRDPSPVDTKYNSSSYQSLNEKEKARNSTPSISISRTKTRESSPLSLLSYRRPSREPSPADSSNKSASTSYGLSSASYNKPTPVASTFKKNPDISISYMSANDASTRPSRASYINRHSPQKDNVVESSSRIPLRTDSAKVSPTENKTTKPVEKSDSETSSSEEDDTDDSSEEEQKEPERKIMIQVTTITRGTSPTAPLENSCPRIRRIEVAKTLEKVRQRPLVGPLMVDKSTQSDDSSRYSSCGVSSRAAYSTYSPTSKSYSRYSSTLTPAKYSREPSESLSTAENDNSESDRLSQRSDKFNFKLPSSKEASPSKESSQSSALTKSSSPCNLLKQRVEASRSAKLSISSRESSSLKKLDLSSSNKDFRKSALNMGPTDRKRNSKSTSDNSPSPTVELTRIKFQELCNTDIKISHPEASFNRDSQSEESSEREVTIEQKLVEPSKEEIINQKVEEAKSFLLKTLGNPTQDASAKYSSDTFAASSRLGDLTTEPSVDANSVYSQSPTPDIANDFTEPETICRSSSQRSAEENTLVNGLMVESSNVAKNNNENNKSEKWSWLNENGKSLNESLQNLKRVQSGEKPWWCQSPENKNTSDQQAVAQNYENTQCNLWEQETQADVSEIQRDDDVNDVERNQSRMETIRSAYSLGDRASPEGVEAAINQNAATDAHQNGYQKYELGNYNAVPQLFISKHTNIDDLLGNNKGNV